MFTYFLGNLLREVVSINSWEFLQNFTPRNSWEILLTTSPEIPEKFLGLGHHIFWLFLSQKNFCLRGRRDFLFLIMNFLVPKKSCPPPSPHLNPVSAPVLYPSSPSLSENMWGGGIPDLLIFTKSLNYKQLSEGNSDLGMDNSVLNAFILSGPRKLNYRRMEDGRIFFLYFSYFEQ